MTDNRTPEAQGLADEIGISPSDFPRWTSPVPLHYVKGEYLSVSTIAMSTNMTEPQVRNAITNGTLPGYKFPNGRVLVKIVDLADYLMGFAAPVPAAAPKGK